MTKSKSGAAMAAALGVILVLALPGCSSSDSNDNPSGQPPPGGGGVQPDGAAQGAIPDAPTGTSGLNAVVNGASVQYADTSAKTRSSTNLVAASKSSDPNVGDFVLKLPGDFRLHVPVMTPGNYGCAGGSAGSPDTAEASVTIGGDDSYSTANARNAGTANPCTMTIDVSDGAFLRGTIREIKLVNSAGKTATISGRFTAQVRR